MSVEAGIGLMILGAVAYPVIAWLIIRAHELENVDYVLLRYLSLLELADHEMEQVVTKHLWL